MNKIRFADGNYLENIKYDNEEYPGSCPTCDLGAYSIEQLEIYTTHYVCILTLDNDCHLFLSESSAIQLIDSMPIKEVSEKEFRDNFRQYVCRFLDSMVGHSNFSYENKEYISIVVRGKRNEDLYFQTT